MVCFFSVIIAGFIFTGHKVFAGSYPSTNLPTDIQNHLYNYDRSGSTFHTNEQNWISQAGVVTNDSSIPVSIGSHSVPIQFNSMVFADHTIVDNGTTYFPNDAAPNSNNQQRATNVDIISTNPEANGGSYGCTTSTPYGGGPSNPCAPPAGGYPAGQQFANNWSSTSRFWGDPNGLSPFPQFYYVPGCQPAGCTPTFTSTSPTVITLYVTVLQINTFYDPGGTGANSAGYIYTCVGGSSGDASSATDFSACDGGNPNCVDGPSDPSCLKQTISVTFQLQISNVAYNVDNATCNLLNGWAFDSSNSSASLNIDVYVNSPSGPEHTYAADQPSADVDSAYSITGNHRFSIDPQTDSFLSTYANSGTAFTVYLDAISVNGSPTSMGQYTIGPCGGGSTLSCSASGLTAANTGKATAPASEPVSGTYTYYTWDQTSPGDPTATPPVAPTYGWVAHTGTYSGTANYQNMTVNYSYTHGGGGAVVSNTSQNPYYFTAGAYYGFDGVNFSGSANYSYTYTYTSYGQPQTGTATTTHPVTVTPGSLNPCVLGTPQCQVNISSYYGYAGTGRAVNMTFAETGYQIGSSGAPPSGAAGDSFPVNFSGPGSVSPGSGNYINNVSYSGGTATYSTAETSNMPGDYAVNWELDGPSVPGSSPSNPCSSNYSVADQPYLGASGGDVIAGSGFEPICSQGNNSTIDSWNNNDGAGNQGYNNGAGTQFATQALGPIDGFSSSQGSSAGMPKGLSFANTSGTFGGSFGVAPCAYDYYGSRSQTSLAQMPTVNTDTCGTKYTMAGAWNGGLCITGDQYFLSNISTGSYKSNDLFLGYSLPASAPGTYISYGHDRLNANSMDVASGNQITIYVNGNVYIGSNITYAGTSNNPNNMTSLHIVANGNIYITPQVSELDGVYTAQNGSIYTCSTGPGFSITTSATSEQVCNTQLTVNGAFVAKHIYLWHTFGTMGTASNSSQNPGQPAEKFNYSPYVWLAKPTTPASRTFDAVTNLPPVL